MKRKKQELKEALIEGVFELILTIVLCAVGFLLCSGIGSVFSIDLTDLDPDSFVLIGILLLVVIIVIIHFVISFFKRKHKEE